MTALARKELDRINAAIEKLGGTVDPQSVAIYVQIWEIWMERKQQYDEKPSQNLLKQILDCSKAMSRLLREFGVTSPKKSGEKRARLKF